ncbi:MAG: SDR family oxidoreductase [Candidatus Levybacteria bacterium]|nr:SDR family oxidoreductase [Candidatus Levybacteria bacterium]
MPDMLKDKVILVTGGKGLLGRAIVNDLRAKGAIAIKSDLFHSGKLDEFDLHCDITSMDSIKEAIAWLVNRFGRVDGWVNNAYPRTKDWGADFLDMQEDSLKKNVDWQLNSYILCCQQIIKQMIKQKSGAIVNMASIYGVVGNDFTIYKDTGLTPPAAYPAIKSGLIGFSRFLASKYGELGIRTNVVSPGGIFDHQHAEFVKRYEEKVPMKRMGTPEDIAPAVSFLLSEEAKYITGQNLVVDGGWTAI